MEVFWCSAPNTPERAELAAEMLLIWERYPINLHILTPDVVRCDQFHFQRERRIWAELRHRDPFYILVDDDCEPDGIETLEQGMKCLQSHNDFAIVSAFPRNENFSRWEPGECYTTYEDLSVIECHDVGTFRFVRAGCMTKGWPQQARKGYDPEHCMALRAAGWRVGMSQHARYIHHGTGAASDLWKEMSHAG